MPQKQMIIPKWAQLIIIILSLGVLACLLHGETTSLLIASGLAFVIVLIVNIFILKNLH